MTDTQPKPQHPRTAPVFRGKLARRMVLLLVPAVLLPVIIMGWLLTERAQNSLQRQIADQLRQAETEMQLKINEWLLAKSARIDVVTHRQRFIEAAHQLLTVRHYDPHFSQAQHQAIEELIYINRYETYPIFNNFFILAPDYSILASSNPTWTGLQIQRSPLAKIIAQAGKAPEQQGLGWFGSIAPSTASFTPDAFGGIHFLIYNYSPLPSDKQRTFLFTVVAYTDPESGETLYIVGVSEELAMERLIRDLASRYPYSTGYFLLYDGTYLTIDPSTNALIAKQAPPALTQGFSPQTNLSIETTYTSPIKEEPALSVAQWIPALNAGIGLELPSTILTQRSQELLPYAIRLFVLTALFLAAIIWLTATYISRPILEIANTARRFAEGDWLMRAPVKRDDEIGLLAHTFNQMADELNQFYRSLEQQVRERTEQIQTASEVAALATSATDLSEILRRTVDLIVSRFPQYYHASVFLIDENDYAVLEASTGPIGEQMKLQGHRLKVGSQSVVGWAAQNRQPRIASDVMEDPIHFKNPLLPETRSEAAIPLIIGNRVLGVLDVQSKNPKAFDAQSVATLQTLASQLAAAIYNAYLREQAEMGLGETQTLYQISHRIVSARTEREIIKLSTEALRELPFISAIFVRDKGETYRLMAAYHPEKPDLQLEEPYTTLAQEVVQQYLPDANPLVFNDLRSTPTHTPLVHLAQALGCVSATYLTISSKEGHTAVVLLGSEQPGTFTVGRLQPYTTLVEITGAALERTAALATAERCLQEFQVMTRLSQRIGSTTSPQDFYRSLHEEIRNLFGEVGMIIALYDPLKRQIEVPYAHEQGEEELLHIDPFPLGEGLLSRVLVSRRALLIERNTAEHSRKLGAKTVGKPAKSWLGVPLITGDQLIGALVLQDAEHENRFTQEDLDFVTAIATSVALLLNKIRLIAQTETVYQRERLLFEINQRAQMADINEMLQTTLQGLQRTLRARRGVIRLHLTSNDDDGSDDASGGAV